MTTTKTHETRVRRLAARNGYYVRKSRQVHPLENLGEYMLLEESRNIPVLGFRFDASIEEIEEYFRVED